MPNENAYIVSYCFQEKSGAAAHVRSMLVVATSLENAKTGAKQLVQWKLQDKVGSGEVSLSGEFSISIVQVDKAETFQVDSDQNGGVVVREADIVGHEVSVSEPDTSRAN